MNLLIKSIAIITALGYIMSCSETIKKENSLISSETPQLNTLQGGGLFQNNCASCHLDNGLSGSPDIYNLMSMTPRSIVSALENGKMQIQGELLSKKEKISIAEYLTKRPYSRTISSQNICSTSITPLKEVKYFGWGGNLEGSGFIDSSIAQLPPHDVPKLELKWAFGIDGGTSTRIKPTVIDDYIIFGSQFGEVYCLDMYTGCVKWSFEASGNIRGGMAVSTDLSEKVIIYFTDYNESSYALDANNGNLIWKVSVRNEPQNAITGTPIYYDGLLYIPLSSMESNTAVRSNYECCKNSGQVVALDAITGEEIWRYRVIPELATERGMNSAGVKKFGPSGSAVWSSPTVDTKRGFLYIGTGQNYSNPPTTNSDALQALDLKTGKLIWNYQATAKDVYIRTCPNPENPNCEDASGPDLDFGIAPILVRRIDGTEVLLSGQKSGVLHCLNPDNGELLWKKRIGHGGAMGGIHWGIASDGKYVYAPNSDIYEVGSDPNYPASPGLYALDLLSGEVIWESTADPKICDDKPGCYNANSAGPTVIPGVVFAGGLDGYGRAYDSNTGQVLWEFDTHKEFVTVNDIFAKGGSIDGPSPVVANGFVFFSSGYIAVDQMPGNVLLAFSVK